MCGPEPFGVLNQKKTQGFVIDINTGALVSTFNGDGDGFQNPHDVAVSDDGAVVYEVELRPFKAWKLTNGEQGGRKPARQQQQQQSLFQTVSGWFG